MSTAEVTVVVVNWNSGRDLADCVASLERHTHVPWELLVVDNGSTDGSLGRLLEAVPGTRTIKTGANLGYAGGVNQALHAVRSPYVVLVNPDAFVHEGCVDHLLARAKSSDRIAAVGAGLRNPDGSLQPALRNFPSPLTHLIESLRLYRWLRRLPGIGSRYLLLSRQDRAMAVDWVVGACMLVRLHAVGEVGLFDDGYFMYSEELDWCLRAHRHGWEMWFEPRAVATHRLGGSSRQDELRMMVEGYRSMYRFYERYYPRSWSRAARLITRFAMIVRILSLPFRRARSGERLAAYRAIARL